MKAYITLLSTNEYLDGVLVLHQSLKEVGAKYPLVVVVTNNINPYSRNILSQKKIQTIEVENFFYRPECVKAFSAWGMPHWKYTAAKIRIFGLTEFEKLVYLDSDMMVLRNIDHLFDCPDGSAAEDSSIIFEENIESHKQLNSGLLVIVPSKEKEQKLIELSKTCSGADQDLIRKLYANWIKQENLHLPNEYNIFNSFVPNYIKKGLRVEEFFVIHFIGKEKPFMTIRKNYSMKNFSEYFENKYRLLLRRAQNGLVFG